MQNHYINGINKYKCEREGENDGNINGGKEMNPLLASLQGSCNILKHSFYCLTEFFIFQRAIQSGEEFYIFMYISSALWCDNKGTIAKGNIESGIAKVNFFHVSITYS